MVHGDSKVDNFMFKKVIYFKYLSIQSSLGQHGFSQHEFAQHEFVTLYRNIFIAPFYTYGISAMQIFFGIFLVIVLTCIARISPNTIFWLPQKTCQARDDCIHFSSQFLTRISLPSLLLIFGSGTSHILHNSISRCILYLYISTYSNKYGAKKN